MPFWPPYTVACSINTEPCHSNAARTLVVKPRSDTISALAMLRGSLSSLSCSRQQQGSGLLVR